MLNLEIRSLTRASKFAVFVTVFCLTRFVSASHAAGPPPVITAQPLDQTVPLKGTATFSVEVSSSTTLSFQWRKNGTNISGATQGTFSIPSVSANDTAKYSVRIANGGGSVTSADATLIVLLPPSITAHPQNQTVAAGESASFSVAATGTAPISYRWQFNGVTLPGKTNATLSLSNIGAENIGNYSVIATNLYGSVTSSVATLTLQSLVARENGNKDDDDYLEATVVDADGNVYVTGSVERNDTKLDFATMKFDSQGNLLWQAIYNNSPIDGDDLARFLAVDTAGNVYVAGTVEAQNETDYATLKYDSNGNLLWAKRYNGDDNHRDTLTGMAVDADGNVFVTGASRKSGAYNYVTIKYHPDGTQAWLQRYSETLTTENSATALALDANGNVYVTGKSRGLLSGYDFATIKYGKNGNQVWVAKYSGDLLKDDVPAKIAVDALGNVFVSGTTAGLLGTIDFITIKYNSNGGRQWTTTYNGPNNRTDRPVDMIIDGNGNIFVTGASEVTAGSFDYATIKYNTAGQQLWVKRYSGTGNDEPTALALDPAGNVFVTGASVGSGTSADFATVKYLSEDGTEVWVARFHSSGNNFDKATSLAIDHRYNVYVGGQAFNKLDYTLLKYESGPHPLSPVTTLANQSVAPGQNATFSVRVTGSGPVSYQWLHNGRILPGATNAILALNGVSKVNAGNYQVVITNSAGEITIGPASLSLTNVLAVAGADSLNTNGFSFQISTTPGSTYVMQCSTNGTDWFPIATNLAANAEVVFTDPSAGRTGLRLYRMLVRGTTNATPSTTPSLRK